MYIGKVIGNVVSTTKSEQLTGLKLLLIQQIDMLTMKPAGTPVVIADTVGAGVGEVVMVVTGGSARLTEQTTGKPVDGSIIGIIDSIEMDGTMLFQKYPPKVEDIINTNEEPKTTTHTETAVDSIKEELQDCESKEENHPDEAVPIFQTETKEIPKIEKTEPEHKPQEEPQYKAQPPKTPSPESKKELLEKVTKKKKH